MADAAATVEKFNQQFPVKSTVKWRSIASDKCPHKEYTVFAPAEVRHGQPVTWFYEKSGMVSIEPEFVDYEK